MEAALEFCIMQMKDVPEPCEDEDAETLNDETAGPQGEKFILISQVLISMTGWRKY